MLRPKPAVLASKFMIIMGVIVAAVAPWVLINGTNSPMPLISAAVAFLFGWGYGIALVWAGIVTLNIEYKRFYRRWGVVVIYPFGGSIEE